MQRFATLRVTRAVRQFVFGLAFAFAVVVQFAEAAAAPAQAPHWVAAWTASAQGPYPVGNPTAQPELKFAFPEMTAPPATRVIVAFGDSITDGTASTLNGDDRWPDVFARRMHAVAGNRFSVVNEGIGGNEVVGPPDYAAKPTPGAF